MYFLNKSIYLYTYIHFYVVPYMESVVMIASSGMLRVHLGNSGYYFYFYKKKMLKHYGALHQRQSNMLMAVGGVLSDFLIYLR